MKENRFCPNCGSSDVEPETENIAYVDMGNFNDWRCNDCDYTGLMPEGEPDEELESKSSENYPRFNTNYAKAELKLFLYIGLPLIILYIFYLLILQ